MHLVAGAPSRWLATLVDGSVVEVWADAVEGLSGPDDDREYTFGSVMDIDEGDQDEFAILARTPSNPRRVHVAVARFRVEP